MDSRQMGSNAETRFVNLCVANNWTYEKSTREQDMFEHWDYFVNGKKVEVKSRKKRRRADASVNDDVIYVEFKNVRGDDGWLYGKADCVAFERPEGFIIVKLSDLADLAERLVSSQFDNRPNFYMSYRRRDRPDEHVGLIKYSDLLTIDHKIVRDNQGE